MTARVDCITTGLFQENCFLVYDDQAGEGFVIDPGEGVDTIINAIETAGFKPKAIINTHAHIDHVQGVKGVREKYSIPFLLHPEEEFWVDQAMDAAARYGVDLDGPPRPFDPIAEGDLFEAGSVKLKAIHTPGHTPGGICFLGEDFLIAGDTLFNGSVGRTDFPKSSFEQLRDSIRNKLFVLDPEIVVHCGHYGSTTIGREKQENPFVGDGVES